MDRQTRLLNPEQARLAHLQTCLAQLPEQSGVYLMRDHTQRIIYVGKAVNLKKRVKSYFKGYFNHCQQQHTNQPPKITRLIAQVVEIETVVTDNEMEALTLECNLIKEHRPRYNLLLKDDKAYPYIKITLREPYPRVCRAHRLSADGSRYFGPYPDVAAMHKTLELLHELFPLRSCAHLTTQRRPCLQYYLHRCAAPCAGKITPRAYDKMIQTVIAMLSGQIGQLRQDLTQQMQTAAQRYAFEEAAQLRDQLQAITRIMQKQKAIMAAQNEMDLISLVWQETATHQIQFCLQVFGVRAGKLVNIESNSSSYNDNYINNHGDNSYLFTSEIVEVDEILSAFIKQYYNCNRYNQYNLPSTDGTQPTTLQNPLAKNYGIPRQIILEQLPADSALLTEWLSRQAGKKVTLVVPKQGIKYQLLQLAKQNAQKRLREQLYKNSLKPSVIGDNQLAQQALTELATALEAPDAHLRRIDCFDISHTQGINTVASMIVFLQGQPSPIHYRRYKISSTEGAPDDFRAMQEVVYRRYQRLATGDQKCDPSATWPDLIIIDGGRGQLSSALEALSHLTVPPPPSLLVIALAKQEEEIFTPDAATSLRLPRQSAALQLIRHIRDEAHRFAITYHRQLRAKSSLRSILDQLPGIGPKRKAVLYQTFGSLAAIRHTSLEELVYKTKIPTKVAQQLLAFLQNLG